MPTEPTRPDRQDDRGPERPRRATVIVAEDGLPLVVLAESETITNDDAVMAIRRQRDGG